MVKIGSFWGQNDATGQNLGKAVKKFFTKCVVFDENGQNWVILDHDFRDKNDPVIQ